MKQKTIFHRLGAAFTAVILAAGVMTLGVSAEETVTAAQVRQTADAAAGYLTENFTSTGYSASDLATVQLLYRSGLEQAGTVVESYLTQAAEELETYGAAVYQGYDENYDPVASPSLVGTLGAAWLAQEIGDEELSAQMVAGDLDIALVPANMASILYQKTEGGVQLIDINTLGVLYVVSADTSIQSIADLAGKTVYMTGKGTTPEYAFNYLLSANGLSADDVTIEFKSEATEVAAILKEQPDAIGLLPQPFVTVAMSQNENLQMVLDLTEEWDKVQAEDGGSLVTGVTVCRSQVLEEQPEAVDRFIAEHKASTEFANTDVEAAAELVAAAGIIEKAPVAVKAMPYCSIVCIDGSEMKDMVSGYLSVLYEQDPASVGGALPDDAFYYLP